MHPIKKGLIEPGYMSDLGNQLEPNSIGHLMIIYLVPKSENKHRYYKWPLDEDKFSKMP